MSPNKLELTMCCDYPRQCGLYIGSGTDIAVETGDNLITFLNLSKPTISAADDTQSPVLINLLSLKHLKINP